MTILILLILALIAVFVIPRLFNDDEVILQEIDKAVSLQPESEAKKTYEVLFMGGPMDGKKFDIDRSLDWFVTPYIPEEGGEEIGYLQGITFYKPLFAYYRQVTEDTYFFVRDISIEEFERSMRSRTAPEIEENSGTA